MKQTALLIKENLENFTGNAKLYKLSDSIRFNSRANNGETKYLVVSRANIFGRGEVMAFPADKVGNILDWGEIYTSYNDMNHDSALIALGLK